MDARGFDLIGVQRDGLVAGFTARAELTSGRLGDRMQPFTPDDRKSSPFPVSHFFGERIVGVGSAGVYA